MPYSITTSCQRPVCNRGKTFRAYRYLRWKGHPFLGYPRVFLSYERTILKFRNVFFASSFQNSPFSSCTHIRTRKRSHDVWRRASTFGIPSSSEGWSWLISWCNEETRLPRKKLKPDSFSINQNCTRERKYWQAVKDEGINIRATYLVPAL